MPEGAGEIPVNREVRPAAAVDRERRFQEAVAERNPLATGEWFKIVASTPDPRGFVISTKEVEGRREVEDYPGERVHGANVRELAFQQKREDRKAASEEREPEAVELTGETFGRPKVVVRGFETTKVVDPSTGEHRDGLALTLSGNSYASYREFSGVDEGETGKQLGNILGVAMGIVTNDGNIIAQKRGKNATYGDDVDDDPGRGIPGASAAGTLDAKLAPREAIKTRASETGKEVTDVGIMVEPIDTDYITEGMYKEAEEEDGVHRSEIEISPNLLIEDAINPHMEVGLTGVTTLSTSEFLQRAEANQRENRGRYHFAERVVVLTPDEFETMLTTVEVPWPPTHAGAMLGTLQRAYIQKGMSPEVAERRMFDIRDRMYANNRRINERIRNFYDTNPEELERNRQKVPNLTDIGYDPRVFGKDQGVGVLDKEMAKANIGGTTERALQEAGISAA